LYRETELLNYWHTHTHTHTHIHSSEEIDESGLTIVSKQAEDQTMRTYAKRKLYG